MNQKTKYIATLIAAVCTAGAGIASAAIEKVVVTQTKVVKQEPSAGQIAGQVIFSPLWLAGNIVMLPFRAASGTEVWPSPAPIGEMTSETKTITYSETMAAKHKYHHRKHLSPVGERCSNEMRKSQIEK